MVLERKKQAKKLRKKISSSPLDYFDFQNLCIAKMRKNEEECVKKNYYWLCILKFKCDIFFLFQEGKKSGGMGAIDAKDKNLIFIFWF